MTTYDPKEIKPPWVVSRSVFPGDDPYWQTPSGRDWLRYRVRRLQLLHPQEHFGVSQAEWSTYVAQSVKDRQEDPSHIEHELSANLGAVAFSEQPFVMLQQWGERLTGKRSTADEIVFDSLFRRLMQKIGFRFDGLDQQGMSSETAYRATLTLLDSVSGAGGSQETPDHLNQRIRDAARTLFRELFAQANGQPAELPRTIGTKSVVTPADVPASAAPPIGLATAIQRWSIRKTFGHQRPIPTTSPKNLLQTAA